MNWRKLSIEELNEYRYPNLVAEIIESDCSICALSRHMGYGMCSEDNPLIRSKVFEDGDLTYMEGVALAGLFGCELEYLFADRLSVVEGNSVAFYRYYERNQRLERKLERDLEIHRLTWKLNERMKKEEDFFLLMQLLITTDMKDIHFETGMEVA